MNDTMILYTGMFCFGMIGIAMAITVYEFKKLGLEPVNKLLLVAKNNETKL